MTLHRLVGYSPQVAKSRTRLSDLTFFPSLRLSRKYTRWNRYGSSNPHTCEYGLTWKYPLQVIKLRSSERPFSGTAGEHVSGDLDTEMACSWRSWGGHSEEAGVMWSQARGCPWLWANHQKSAEKHRSDSLYHFRRSQLCLYFRLLAYRTVRQFCCSVAQLCLVLWQPRDAGLLCPWDFPGKNTAVGCHFLLQGIFHPQGSNLCLLHWQKDSLPLSHQEALWGNTFEYMKPPSGGSLSQLP